VFFTYQLAKHPQVGYTGRQRFAEVDTAIVVDAKTIRFIFKKSYPEALLDLQIPILPKHILALVPPEQIRQCAFNRQPVGNGAAAVWSRVIEIPPEGLSLQEGERKLVQEILRLTKWNKTHASKILGISRPRLSRKIEEYHIEDPRERHHEFAEA